MPHRIARVVVIAVASLPLLAGCARHRTPADFAGTWTGEAWCINTSGDPHVEQVLRLEVADHGRVRGSIGWRSLDGNRGHDQDGNLVVSHEEQIIGLASLRDGTIALVETAENGTLLGTLTPDGRLELLRTQPGETPVVTFAILSRSAPTR
jgi:hypothetical protein